MQGKSGPGGHVAAANAHKVGNAHHLCTDAPAQLLQQLALLVIAACLQGPCQQLTSLAYRCHV